MKISTKQEGVNKYAGLISTNFLFRKIQNMCFYAFKYFILHQCVIFGIQEYCTRTDSSAFSTMRRNLGLFQTENGRICSDPMYENLIESEMYASIV